MAITESEETRPAVTLSDRELLEAIYEFMTELAPAARAAAKLVTNNPAAKWRARHERTQH